MHLIEADADLLAACRTRQHISDELEDIAERVDWLDWRAFVAGDFAAPCGGIKTDIIQLEKRQAALAVELLTLDRAIAEVLAQHLLNPAPARDALMVVPSRGAHGALRGG